MLFEQVHRIRSRLVEDDNVGIRIFCDDKDTILQLLTPTKRAWVKFSSIFVTQSTWNKLPLTAETADIDCIYLPLLDIYPPPTRQLIEASSAFIGSSYGKPTIFVLSDELALRENQGGSTDHIQTLVDELKLVPKVNIVASPLKKNSVLHDVVLALRTTREQPVKAKRGPVQIIEECPTVKYPFLQNEDKRYRNWLFNEIEPSILQRLTDIPTISVAQSLRPLKLPNYFVAGARSASSGEESEIVDRYARALENIDSNTRDAVEEITARLLNNRVLILGGFGSGTDFVANLVLTKLGTISNCSSATAKSPLDRRLPLSDIMDVYCHPTSNSNFSIDPGRALNYGFVFRNLLDPKIPVWDPRTRKFNINLRNEALKSGIDGKAARDDSGIHPFGIGLNWIKPNLISLIDTVKNGDKNMVAIFTTRYRNLDHLFAASEAASQRLKRGTKAHEDFITVHAALAHMRRDVGPDLFVRLSEYFTAGVNSGTELTDEPATGIEVEPSVSSALLKIFTEHRGLDFRWAQHAHMLLSTACFTAGRTPQFGHWSQVIEELTTYDQSHNIKEVKEFVTTYFQAAADAAWEIIEPGTR